MSAPLDYDFVAYAEVGCRYDRLTLNAVGRRLIDFEEAGNQGELFLAAKALVAAFDAAAPSLIDRGLLTGEEARGQRHVLSAIAADLKTDAARREQIRAWLAGEGPEMPPAVGAMIELQDVRAPWADKVAALRRIIEKRRASFAEDVDKGLASPIEARAMLERLEAIHAKYWLDGFAFDGSVDELRNHIACLSEAAIAKLTKDQAA